MASRGDIAPGPVAWIGATPLDAATSERLAAAGLVVRSSALTTDLDKAAAAIVGDERPDLIVCDCSGERGYERAFFVCRAAERLPVLLVAISEDAEDRVAETLMVGLLKALPQARVALLSDRVDEVSRATGGARRVSWAPEDLAAAVLEIRAAPSFPTGSTIRLKNRESIR